MEKIHVVRQIMSKSVSTLDASDTLHEALRVMTEKGVGCIVITSDSQPVGILTERDAMKAMMRGNEVLTSKVGEVMSLPLTTVSPDTPVVDALKVMKSRNIRRLPVVRDGELQGIITVHHDLLYWALAGANEARHSRNNPGNP